MFYKMLMNFDTNKRPHGGIYMEMIFPTEATGRGGVHGMVLVHQWVLFNLYEILNASELSPFKIRVFHTRPRFLDYL